MTEDRRATLERLRALHSGLPEGGASPARPTAPAPRTDMTTLAGYRQIRVAHEAAKALGLAAPYFRAAREIAGTRVRLGDRWAENFSSYDYLSLNDDPRLARAVAEAVGRFGVSARASRLVGGELALHGELERALAGFLGTEAALAFVSGHATNLAVIRTLTGPGDAVLVDSLAHNSIYEGVRASGADHVTVPHNDTAWLDDWLARNRDRHARVLIVVEGLYSMDGDRPDLAALVRLKERHEAWLMLDEAHAFGVLGARGAGSCEAAGIAPDRVDIIMGTLSKSLCSCGGFVAGSATLVDLLKHAAPSFVYSVGLSVPNAAAARAALDAIADEPERVARLRAVSARFLEAARAAGLDCGASEGHAVAPIIVGDSVRATWLSQQLLEDGVQVLPIIAPAVPNRKARLRFFLNAGHDEEAVRHAVERTAARIDEARRLTG